MGARCTQSCLSSTLISILIFAPGPTTTTTTITHQVRIDYHNLINNLLIGKPRVGMLKS